MVAKKTVKKVSEKKTAHAEKTIRTKNIPKTQKVRISQRTISGKVRYSDGTPCVGLIVKAFDRNIGADDTLLGQGVTDTRGIYVLSYPLEMPGSKSAADLILMVFYDEKLVQQSDIIFNAQASETKDFILPVTIEPGFVKLSAAIAPLLPKKTGLPGLEKNQIIFLTKKDRN
jgi:hypothetical protein